MTQKQRHFSLQNMHLENSKNIFWIVGGLPKKMTKLF